MGIIQIIPADDWYEKKNDDEKVILTKLVCFALDDGGNISAMIADASGAILPIPESSNLEYKKPPVKVLSNTTF